jgi:serine protease Do
MTQQIPEQCIFKVNTASGSGTSFYLKDKNIFVTNYHVVGAYKQVSVQDQVGNRYLATVVLANPHEDLAFLRTTEKFNVPQLELHAGDPLRQGDKVFVAGYPFGMPFTVTEGVVSAPNQPMEGKSYIQTDAAVNPGNSGGPMISDQGKVIAITTSKFKNADNMGFGVPVQLLEEEFKLLPQLNNHFNLVCGSCSALISEPVEYCNNCGQGIDVNYFNEPMLTDLGAFCEKAIAGLGTNPVLTRQGYEFWEFYVGSSQVRLFVYNQNYLYATSPLTQLPKQNIGQLLEELLSLNVQPFQLGLYNNEVYVSYRVHISDIFSPRQNEISNNITAVFNKANELDDYFVSKYGCEYSVHSRKGKMAS